MNKAFFILCMGAVSPAHADQAVTLQPDSVICEQRENLQFTRQDHLQNKGGAEIMKSAEVEVEFRKISLDGHKEIRKIRIKEEQLRSDAGLSGISGRINAEQETANRDAEMLKEARNFKQRCIANQSPHPAKVVEANPISGEYQIELKMGSQTVRVWTLGKFLSR